MTQKKRNQGNSGNSEQNGNPSDSDELTLPEEAGFLIQIAFEEFEEIIINYPHHAAYCFASITRLVDTTEKSVALRTAVGNVAVDRSSRFSN